MKYLSDWDRISVQRLFSESIVNWKSTYEAEVKANLNPKKRIENAYTQSGRIANSPERPDCFMGVLLRTGPTASVRKTRDSKTYSVQIKSTCPERAGNGG